ncbi:hypothetical protein MNBD_NITROSPINAE05-481 [hydrothermal vent metagenome]|uniref:Uncharacterized protein n=1 Tax=hydrothermal vent metagenome TaxID=652676 RepID=A0A3B1DGR5_9ZZZZ
MEKMNDPAASGRGILQGVLFKSRGKPRGIKPTGGNEQPRRKRLASLGRDQILTCDGFLKNQLTRISVPWGS